MHRSRDCWHDVAYANYVQHLLEKGERPTDVMWKAAEQPFLKLLETLEPDILIIIGRAVWKNLPRKDVELDALLDDRGWRQRIERCEYKLDHGGTVTAIGVLHTRAGLGAPWADRIYSALTTGARK